MQALSEKYMSDEETDPEDSTSFIKRSLKWRSEGLNKLITKLDDRHMKSREKKDNCKPMKKRILGESSDRLPPPSAHDWAIAADYNCEDFACESSSSSPTAPDITPTEVTLPCTSRSLSSQESDNDEDSDMDAWIYQITGVQA